MSKKFNWFILQLILFAAIPCKAAISFNGTNQYISTAGATTSFDFIQKTGIFSITAWIKLSNNTSRCAIVGNNGGGSANSGFDFIYDTLGGTNIPFKTISVFVTKGTVGQPVYACYGGSVTINDTNWHHVAVTSTGSVNSVNGLVFYIDGVATTTFIGNQSPTGFGAASATFTLGIASNRGDIPTLPCNGLIDDLRIYNSVLSSNEILSLARSSSRLTILEKISGWWPMDEGLVNQISGGSKTVLDRTQNSNNGSPVNSPTYAPGILNYP